MRTVLGLAGSLRRGSYNAGLLRAAAAALPSDAQLVIGSITDVPLYNADDEAANGVPPSVVMLRDQLAAADGLLLATPEYNNGIPGVFKNAIDWMASGSGAEVFSGKHVTVMGASPRFTGTVLAQTAWLPVLRALRTRPWFEGRLMLGNARDLFDQDGNLTDDDSKVKIEAFMKGFLAALG